MEFETEEQQIEAIKLWWKEYGPTLFLGLIVGLAGVYGYRYYDAQQEANMASVSDAYNQVIELKVNGDSTNEKFIAAATNFNKEHSDSVYGNLLSLQLAKLAMDAKDLGSAAQHLKDCLSNAQHPIIENVARIRLARVLIAQQSYDDALKVIAEASTNAYQGHYDMLRGDIWMAKGDKSRAAKAYQAAKDNSEDSPTNPNLELLLTELASENTDANASSD